MAVNNELVTQDFEIDGLQFKFKDGQKLDFGDKILYVGKNGQFCQMRFMHLGYILEALFDNEERLYPRREDGSGPRGGYYLLDFLKDCCERGTEQALERFYLKSK